MPVIPATSCTQRLEKFIAIPELVLLHPPFYVVSAQKSGVRSDRAGATVFGRTAAPPRQLRRSHLCQHASWRKTGTIRVGNPIKLADSPGQVRLSGDSNREIQPAHSGGVLRLVVQHQG